MESNGDEPFTRMNNSPIDSVPVQHLVQHGIVPLFRRFPRYVKYGEFNDEKGDKSRAEKFATFLLFPYLLLSVSTVPSYNLSLL